MKGETHAELMRAARRVVPSDVRQARRLEQVRRGVRANDRATVVLKARHRAEFRELVRLERAAIDAESGPLPGD